MTTMNDMMLLQNQPTVKEVVVSFNIPINFTLSLVQPAWNNDSPSFDTKLIGELMSQSLVKDLQPKVQHQLKSGLQNQLNSAPMLPFSKWERFRLNTHVDLEYNSPSNTSQRLPDDCIFNIISLCNSYENQWFQKSKKSVILSRVCKQWRRLIHLNSTHISIRKSMKYPQDWTTACKLYFNLRQHKNIRSVKLEHTEATDIQNILSCFPLVKAFTNGNMKLVLIETPLQPIANLITSLMRREIVNGCTIKKLKSDRLINTFQASVNLEIFHGKVWTQYELPCFSRFRQLRHLSLECWVEMDGLSLIFNEIGKNLRYLELLHITSGRLQLTLKPQEMLHLVKGCPFIREIFFSKVSFLTSSISIISGWKYLTTLSFEDSAISEDDGQKILQYCKQLGKLSINRIVIKRRLDFKEVQQQKEVPQQKEVQQQNENENENEKKKKNKTKRNKKKNKRK